MEIAEAPVSLCRERAGLAFSLLREKVAEGRMRVHHYKE
jgi:hypothetical protein